MPERTRRGPVDPRLLSRARATRFFLGAGVAAGTATAMLVIYQAWLLARTISSFTQATALDGLTTTLVLLAVGAALGQPVDAGQEVGRPGEVGPHHQPPRAARTPR